MDINMATICFKVREDAKEEASKRLGGIDETLSSFCKSAFFSGLAMEPKTLKETIQQGRESEAEWEHRKLEAEFRYSEKILKRKKMDIYGKEGLERARELGYLPEKCSQSNTVFNRAFALVFKKEASGEFTDEQVKRFFQRFTEQLREDEKSPNDSRWWLLNKAHAESIVRFWQETGFSDEDIKTYLLEIEALELLEK